MKRQFVYDPLISKRQQYLLATQVCYQIFSPCIAVAHEYHVFITRVVGACGAQNRSVLYP